MVIFGQIVVGPPGSGKSTYCQGIQYYLQSIGRHCSIINIDFANDNLAYKAEVDVRELISLENVMEKYQLGPNGGLLYCMEYLLANSDWLENKIDSLESNYILFDFPGQVELYTHHKCVQDLIGKLLKLDLRLCSVHLVDAFYCCEPSTFISAALLVVCCMLRLGLPHVNILSKVDILSQYGELPFTLDFFTEMPDLTKLSNLVGTSVHDLKDSDSDEELDTSTSIETSTSSDKTLGSLLDLSTNHLRKYRKLSHGICEVVSDLGLLSFLPLNIMDAETVGRVIAAIDLANGYSFAASETKAYLSQANKNSTSTNVADSNSSYSDSNYLFKLAANEIEPTFYRSIYIQEKYCNNNNDINKVNNCNDNNSNNNI